MVTEINLNTPQTSALDFCPFGLVQRMSNPNLEPQRPLRVLDDDVGLEAVAYGFDARRPGLHHPALDRYSFNGAMRIDLGRTVDGPLRHREARRLGKDLLGHAVQRRLAGAVALYMVVMPKMRALLSPLVGDERTAAFRAQALTGGPVGDLVRCPHASVALAERNLDRHVGIVARSLRRFYSRSTKRNLRPLRGLRAQAFLY